MKTVYFKAPQAIGRKIAENRERFQEPDFHGIELVRIYNDLLTDYSLLLESLQNGAPGAKTRQTNEDPAEVLQTLRETFKSSDLHSHLSSLHDVLKFSEIVEDFRLVTQEITQ